MGRKTFESLGRVLPNRKHIVLTRNKEFKVDNENVIVVNDISYLKEYIESSEENFVIGGADIYKLLLKDVTKMYVTRIKESFEGDVEFPEVNWNEWECIGTKECNDVSSEVKFYFIDYIRK